MLWNKRHYLCKSSNVKRVQDAGSVLNTGGKGNGGVGGKKRYIYLRSSDFFIELVLLVNENNTAQCLSCTTTSHLIIRKPRDQILYSRKEKCTTPGVAFCIPHHFYLSGLVHLGANCVVLRLSYLSNHPTWLPTGLAVEKADATDVIG